MLIYDVLHKEKVHHVVANDLRNLGVKYRLKKNALKVERPERSKTATRKVFKTSLLYQPLDVVNLASGGIVHVPVFVSEASSFLEKHIGQEGLFRKAGSQARQRDLMNRLDNGDSLGEKHHAIDVANCLKSFFRDLPEPLIPYTYHDLFVHCTMLKAHRVQALLLACILLPPHHLNTLAFFMEFLKKVSLHEKQNKMGVDNLAKVIGPNIMPLQEVTMSAVHSRLEMHLIVTKILIENAQKIGVLPDHIVQTVMAETISSTENELNLSEPSLREKSRKKKHRSGSLTRKPHLSASNLNLRMFNGLKKIVGKAGSSDDILQDDNQQLAANVNLLQTTSVKVNKKRKIPERLDVPNTKKKRVADKPDKSKKMRLSLDRFVPKNKQKNVNDEVESCSTRRWSSVSDSSTTEKKQGTYSNKSQLYYALKSNELSNSEAEKDYSDVFVDADVNLSNCSSEQVSLETKNPNQWNVGTTGIDGQDEEYVRISKNEYEDIKNRVSAIESRISQEFGCINNKNNDSLLANSVTKVQTEYEKTLEETKITSTMTTDYLAKRLNKELKIRRSGEHKIIRSPSARKIGSLRRRSQEKITGKRVRRTASWHVSQTLEQEYQIQSDQELNNAYLSGKQSVVPLKCMNQDLAYRTESSIFTGKGDDLPILQKEFNSLFSCEAGYSRNSQRHDDEQKILNSAENRLRSSVHRASSFHGNEFISNSLFDRRTNELKKTNSQQNILNNGYSKEQLSSPTSLKETVLSWKDAENYFKVNNQSTTPVPQTGRASVAKLRKQNAGMVLAKAKLFDESTMKLSTHSQDNHLNKNYFRDEANKHSQNTFNFRKLNEKEMHHANKKAETTCKQLNKSPRSKHAKSPYSSTSPQYVKSRSVDASIGSEMGKRESQQKKDDQRRLSQKFSVSDQKVISKKFRVHHISMDNEELDIESCQKENLKNSPVIKKVSANARLQDSDVDAHKSNNDSLCKTPHIKKPLTVKTPKSARSLVRRPPVDSRRTPLRAVAQLGTPKYQSPKSILKTRHQTHAY